MVWLSEYERAISRIQQDLRLVSSAPSHPPSLDVNFPVGEASTDEGESAQVSASENEVSPPPISTFNPTEAEPKLSTSAAPEPALCRGLGGYFLDFQWSDNGAEEASMCQTRILTRQGRQHQGGG